MSTLQITQDDAAYPNRWLEVLKGRAPQVIHVLGSLPLHTDSIGIVGSRDAQQSELETARDFARSCVEAGYAVVSGAARGIDREAMIAALSIGGTAIGIVCGPMRQVLNIPEFALAIEQGRLTLVSAQAPDARFSIGAAMGRNKLIYGLAEATLVVCCPNCTGGTFEGAKEALAKGFGRVGIWETLENSNGIGELIRLGASPVNSIEMLLSCENEIQPTLF